MYLNKKKEKKCSMKQKKKKVRSCAPLAEVYYSEERAQMRYFQAQGLQCHFCDRTWPDN